MYAHSSEVLTSSFDHHHHPTYHFRVFLSLTMRIDHKQDLIEKLHLVHANPSFAFEDVASRLEIISAFVEIPEEKVSQDEDIGRKSLELCEVVCGLEVTSKMCNSGASIHGGCIAFLVDVCTSMPMMLIMSDDRWAWSGVSANLNVIFHAGAPAGTKLIITSITMNIGKRISNLRCEIRNADTGQLVASGTHAKVDIWSNKGQMRKVAEQTDVESKL